MQTIRIFITLLFVQTVCTAFAQELHIVRQSKETYPRLKKSQRVYTMDPELDTTHATFIAAAEVKANPGGNLEAIYDEVVTQSRSLGANGIRVVDLSEDYSVGRVEFYSLDDALIEANNLLTPGNTLYVFAGEKFDAAGYHTFECNGVSRSVKNGTYFTYALKEGEQIKLRKGTVTGTVMWVKWKPDALPSFITIHGFHKEPVVKRTTQSPSVKPGKFNNVESELGKFLIQILDPSNP